MPTITNILHKMCDFRLETTGQRPAVECGGPAGNFVTSEAVRELTFFEVKTMTDPLTRSAWAFGKARPGALRASSTPMYRAVAGRTVGYPLAAPISETAAGLALHHDGARGICTSHERNGCVFARSRRRLEYLATNLLRRQIH